MSTVNKYTTANIDFDRVRENLKNYLQNQKEFTDYNFEGSGLSVLLNCLAYNTSYNLVYDNFALNEAFLDTAVKKSSVISHANLLNYVPRSRRAPVAKVNVTIMGTTTSPSLLKLDAYSPFKTTINGVNYTFYTTEDYITNKENNTYIFEGVEIHEGSIGYAGGMYNNDDYQCFRLEDNNIDTTTINVLVDEQTDGVNRFSISSSISGLDSTSKVYFLKETPDETYQVEFGNGLIGQALKYGDVVSITYLSTNGETCNGAKTFVYSGILGSQYTIMSVVCTEAALGGAEAEDIESIRKNAPKIYTTQNRCVTANDYKATILAEYPNAKGVNVWGGEDMTPPKYGTVFVSVVKDDGSLLTDDEEEYILKTILLPKKSLATTVEFYDPTYIKIALDSTVYYDTTKTTKTSKDVESDVISEIKSYMEENIGSFDMDLKYSKLVASIDGCNDAITNNQTSISLIGEVDAVYDVATSYSFAFNNAIRVSASNEENVLTTPFECAEYSGYECYIDDNPSDATLRIYSLNEDGSKNVLGTVGTVDYANGVITIGSLTITKLNSEVFEIFVKPKVYDVVTKENQFAILDESRLSVTVNAVS